LRRHKKCCVDYKVPLDFMKLIGTNKDINDDTVDVEDDILNIL